MNEFERGFREEREKIAWSVGEQSIGPKGGLFYSEASNNWNLGPKHKKSGPEDTWTRQPDFYFALPSHLKKKVKFSRSEGVSQAEVEIPLKDVKEISKKHPEILADLKGSLESKASEVRESGPYEGGFAGFLGGGLFGTAAGAVGGAMLGARSDRPVIGGIAGALAGGAAGSLLGTLIGAPTGTAIGAARARLMQRKMMKKFPELATIKEEDYDD